MGRLLKSLVLATSIFTTSPLIASESLKRINFSYSHGKNIKFPNGALENYNPKRFRVGIEFADSNSWFADKYVFTLFIGKVHESYDVGFSVGLKKIFNEDEKIRPFTEIGLGGIYIWKDLQEHQRRLNFYLNFEAGLELELWENFSFTGSIGHGHLSIGKKVKNNIIGRTGKGDNTGNPGLNTRYVSVGVIWKFKYFFLRNK